MGGSPTKGDEKWDLAGYVPHGSSLVFGDPAALEKTRLEPCGTWRFRECVCYGHCVEETSSKKSTIWPVTCAPEAVSWRMVSAKTTLPFTHW